ncbi:MAG: Rpn family recombination-promoting nuclease/putative transposase [Planctomycetaceae bacterium]|jgi:hypothetical protein|nr:Rpn family recombination-promoting nuclease/putative transposase [Planctomycetaceae bacterium]
MKESKVSELIDYTVPLTHDKFFCTMFSKFTDIANEFLRIVLPPKVLEVLDVDGLTVETGTFLNEVFKESRADVVYRVPVRNSEKLICIYTFLEHKSSNDPVAVRQVFSYSVQFGDAEIKAAKDDNSGSVNADFRLSLVILIIIHHGRSRFTGATNVSEVYHKIEGLEEYLPQQKAILFDLNTIPEENLPFDGKRVQLGSVLWLMKNIFKMNIATRFNVVLERLRPYSDIPLYSELIQGLWYYFSSRAKYQRDGDVWKVNETVKDILGEKTVSTILEKIGDKFRVESEAKLLIRSLTLRFGSPSESLTNRIRAITDISEIDRLYDIAFYCESIEAFEHEVELP